MAAGSIYKIEVYSGGEEFISVRVGEHSTLDELMGATMNYGPDYLVVLVNTMSNRTKFSCRVRELAPLGSGEACLHRIISKAQ